jgi:hypothetical protein
LVEATSVVLALSLTPDGKGGAPPANVQPARNVSPAENAVDVPTRLVFGAAARGDVGTLPHATLGVGGELGIERGSWSLRALGTYFLGASGTLESAPALGGNFSWWTGGVLGCGAPSTGTLRIELCAGAELGVLAGQGTGAALASQHPSTLWFAASGNLAASWQLSGSLRLRTSLGVAFPLVGRRPFEINGQRVHEPSVVAGRAEIGPEVVF